MLREIAEKRLAAIKEFTDLGSGFKIAMKDLEIRGAGNLLGKSQSGHMEAVGYDLYCKMLNEEVRRLKGEVVSSDEVETKINIDASAYIPAKYIRNEAARLEMYKRIAAVATEEDVSELKDELIDRYGEMPDEVDNLVNISFIRKLAKEAGATTVECMEKMVKISLYNEIKLRPEKVGEVLSNNEGRIKFRTGRETYYEYKFGDGIHRLKPEEKIKELMVIMSELIPCRQQEEIKEEQC